MINKKNIQRNSSVEVLRIIFMMGIVLLHVYGHGSNLDYDWIYSLGKNPMTSWNLSLFSLSKLGVTGFMFISGYYGITSSAKKLLVLLSTCAFYGFLLGVLTQMPLLEFFYLPFTFDLYWFISSYVVIFAISPLLNTGIDIIGKKRFLAVCIFMILYSYVLKFIKMDNSHDVTFLLTVFLCARYFRLYIIDTASERFNKMIQRIGIVSILLLLSLPIALANTTLPTSVCMKLFIQNNNILLLSSVVGVVSYCTQHTFCNSIINKLAAGSLAIYLITEFPTIRPVITHTLLPYLTKGYGVLIIGAGCIIILIFDQLRQILFNHIFSKR